MGNRAVIVFDEYAPTSKQTALYLHWNGGRDSVEAYLKATRILMHSRGVDPSYARARFVQVIGMFIGGNMSFGLNSIDHLGDQGDNGIYVIDSETLTIKDRPGYTWEEQDEYDLNEFTNEIINRINAMNEYVNKDAGEYGQLEMLPTAEEYDAAEEKYKQEQEAKTRAEKMKESLANL
jgi:hypothetical protein